MAIDIQGKIEKFLSDPADFLTDSLGSIAQIPGSDKGGSEAADKKSAVDNVMGSQKDMMGQTAATVQNLQKATIQPTKIDAPTGNKQEETPPSSGAAATGKSHLADLLTRGGQGTPA